MDKSEKRIYQLKNKERFLNEIRKRNNETIKQFEWLFEASYKHEAKFNRDLFDFNKKQMMEFLEERNMIKSSLIVYLANISEYINFCINNSIKFGDSNVVTEISRQELNKIAKENDHVIRYEIIDSLIGRDNGNSKVMDTLHNFQDRVLIYLIFMGVLGKNYSEIANLKESHIDFENKLIKLSELDENRKDITIDDFGLYLIRKAIDEKEYTKYKTGYNSRDFSTDSMELIDTDYIIKKSAVGRYMKNSPISGTGLRERLKSAAAVVDEPITSVKLIERSGMVYFGKLLVDNGIKLSVSNEMTEKLIFDRYNIQNTLMKYRVLKMIREELEAVYGYDFSNESKESK